MNTRRLHVFLINAVIADKRVGHGNYLTFIGRIGENFLIAGHTGVKNYLPHSFTAAGKGETFKKTAVFEDQQGASVFV